MIHCRQCKHYYITFKPRTPMGCRIFAIESKALPCRVIKEQSGEDCKGFSLKVKKEEKESIDLNDDKLW